jgi:allene oxide cyclase
MRRKLAVVVAGFVVAGGAGIASFVTSSSATAATTLTVIEHAVTDHVTDVGKTGLSAGDLLTFHNPIYNSTDTTVVGSDQGSCIRITKYSGNKKGSWECEWTTFLNSGTDSITVETPYYDTGLGKGAITGGTGAYVGASGSLDLSCSKTECTFKFTLS